MAEINFLGGNKKSRKPHKERKREIEWVKTEAEGGADRKKEKASGLFSFFKKGPAPLGKTEKKEEGFKDHRQAVLEAIKREESRTLENLKKRSWGDILKGVFKKEKKILIDYKKAEAKAKPEAPKKEILKLVPEEKNPKPVSEKEKEKGKSFFEKIFKKKEKGQGKALPEAEAPAPAAAETGEHADILETNLVNKEIVSFFEWKKNISFLIFCLVLTGLIISFPLISLSASEKKERAKNQEARANYDFIMAKINSKKGISGEISDFQKTLKTTSDLFNKHIYWTNFLRFLEANILKNVYLISFAGDTSGKYKISARAQDFGSIVDQIDVLKNNKKVISATTQGGKLQVADDKKTKNIDFDLELTVDPAIFYNISN